MKTFNTIDEILDFAIKSEQGAVDFYTDLAEKVNNEEMKGVFMEFAKEEMGHKSRLLRIKNEKSFNLPLEKIHDMKISDYTTQAEIKPDMDYRDTLVVAMNREKSAFKLYSRLASETDDLAFKNLFMLLAQEEAKHKLRFELEYDDFVLRDN